MKSLNFKRKENAQLRYIEEKAGSKSKPRKNWDRLVYLSILGIIVFFVLRYLFIANFYISADGQVIFENFEITQADDITIERFFCEEGEGVEKGDTLFTYKLSDNSLAFEEVEEVSKSNWADREKYTLEKSIRLNNEEIKGEEGLLNSYHSQMVRLENEVILGTASERDLNNLEYKISKLETAIALLNSENSILNKQLMELNSQENTSAIISEDKTTERTSSPFKAYISPIDGYVSRIFKEPYEIALKSQIILKLHQVDAVHIKGYFEQEDLKYVKEGDLINVNFPDGVESEGVIERFYSSTVLIPEEFQKRFEPAKRTIAVDILPAAGSDLSVWKRYYKLSVKLTKTTF